MTGRSGAEPGIVEMAKQRGRPKGPGGNESTVRIEKRLAKMARSIADHRGMPIHQLLNELLEGPLERAYLAMLRELEGKQGKN